MKITTTEERRSQEEKVHMSDSTQSVVTIQYHWSLKKRFHWI